MAPRDREHFLAKRTAQGSPLGRCPYTSDPWAFSCALDWGLLRRNCSTRTGFHRSHNRNNPVGKRRIRTAYQVPAMLEPLRSTAANSAKSTVPMTVTSSWCVGQQLLVMLFLALDQSVMEGCVFDVYQLVAAANTLWRIASKWQAQVQWFEFAIEA